VSTNLLGDSVLPVPLSGQLIQSDTQTADAPADILLNGIPFWLWPSSEDPWVRDVQEDQREQFDNSQEAGENSFGFWWLRSQSTFHGGQGQKFLDSSESAVSRTRYWSSKCAYPHTAGELTIAGALTNTGVSGFRQIEQVTWSGVQKAVFMSQVANEVTVKDLPGLTSPTVITLGASGTPAAMTSDGANVFVAINDRIYRIVPGGTATHIYNLTFSGAVAMGFTKQRLIVCSGNKVYELDPNPAGPPIAAPPPKYTNPSTGYIYTSVSEGPNGIYLSGYAGPVSDVSSMTVTDSGGTLVLGAPVVQLRTPPGERVMSVFFYVNNYFALATTNGVRVGQFSPYGQPQMGPLMMAGTKCYSATGSGTLVWIGAERSVWWVDLSTPIDDAGTYAHAMYTDDLGAGVGDFVNDLTVLPGAPDLVFATTDQGGTVYQTSFAPTQPAELTTSWSRFGTTEPKQLHYVRVDGTFPVVGGVQNVCTVVVESDLGETVTFNIEGGEQTSHEFSTSALSPAQTFRVSFTLRDAGAGNGVTLRSFQLKALPAPRKFAEHILPLRCFDSEQDRNGRETIRKGWAAQRVKAVEELAQQGVRITVKDKIMNTSYQAVIRRCQFRQTTNPTTDSVMGGLLNVIVRQV
jgi:hypothetical protein